MDSCSQSERGASPAPPGLPIINSQRPVSPPPLHYPEYEVDSDCHLDIDNALEDIEYPESILNLSQNIKSYDEKLDDDVEYSVISHFDHRLLLQKCIPSSPTYESGMDLDLLCKCLFRTDEWWANYGFNLWSSSIELI